MRVLGRHELVMNPTLLTDDSVRCDYVYSYPPRQAYRPLDPRLDVSRVLESSIQHDPRVNLYLHFPFCRQICSFCNLYTTPVAGDSQFEHYVDLLEIEIRMRAPIVAGSEVRSVYLGGGTPSLMSPSLIDRVLKTLERELGFHLRDVLEVAIEVAPDTADSGYLAALRSIGINRINIGLQSSSAKDLRSIGRRYGPDTNEKAIESALSVGFDNVCVDLIYGLPGQDEKDWLASVQWVEERRPETICVYPLTVRKGTRYGAARHGTDSAEQYRRYDLVDWHLRASGYKRETHVRWSLPGRGGYKQKEYHWACENVVGFGAGARSYLWGADLRNGYSLGARKSALRQYEQRITSGLHPAVDGFVMTRNERMRKNAILGLIDLDGRTFLARHGIEFSGAFPDEWALLVGLSLAERRGASRYVLTDRGVRHRDVIAQIFFSRHMTDRVSGFGYDE